MEHPDNGLIQAFLDREMVETEADALRAHLAGCGQCRAAAESLEEASWETERALLHLDTEPRPERSRNRILEKRRVGSPRVTGRSISLPKAASIALLLTGAAVTALPGSPVRRWVVEGWRALAGPTEAGSGMEATGEEGANPEALLPEPGIRETGASIPASTQGVELWIHDLAPAAELRVVWTEGEEAWIYAGEGTRFNRVGSRLEAFSPPGAVRVEIPRSLEEIVLRLNGSVLLRKSGGEVEILGPAEQRTPSEIIFQPLPSPNAGLP
jgi:hypothetical protein